MKTPTIPAHYATDESLSSFYLQGYRRGFNVASWQEIPEVGTRLPRDMDWQGIGTVESEADQADAMQMAASEAESRDREYSTFEFTASEINERDDADECWNAFDEGISDGIQANISSRLN